MVKNRKNCFYHNLLQAHLGLQNSNPAEPEIVTTADDFLIISKLFSLILIKITFLNFLIFLKNSLLLVPRL